MQLCHQPFTALAGIPDCHHLAANVSERQIQLEIRSPAICCCETSHGLWGKVISADWTSYKISCNQPARLKKRKFSQVPNTCRLTTKWYLTTWPNVRHDMSFYGRHIPRNEVFCLIMLIIDTFNAFVCILCFWHSSIINVLFAETISTNFLIIIICSA